VSPNLTVVIPTSLETILNNEVVKRASSFDSVVSAALSQYFHTARHRIYQVSTSAALVQGVYEGAVSSRVLLANGDFGVGTFERLDGEMVILDGAIYQACGDQVHRRDDDFLVPFATVTRLQKDEVFPIERISSLKDLQLACDSDRISDNLFYALRLDGVFESVHVRAVHPVTEGTRLVDAAGTQMEFHFQNIEGTLVGIWSPNYSGSFSISGYHFHYISKDRTKGGHVLNCNARQLLAQMQILFEYDVQLPDGKSFLSANLNRNPAPDLAKAEQVNLKGQ
jgi:acetolactate decarboxylase